MTYTVGDTARDATSLSTSGQTWTRLASSIAGVSTVWSPTLTERSSGSWEAEQELSSAGTWLWWGESTDGTRWVIEWEAVAASTVVAPLTAVGITTTRKLIRREIGRELRDCDIVVATGGTDTIFIDPDKLNSPSNAYKGRTIYFTGGSVDNIGLVRAVTASSPSTRSVEWTTALPATVTADDEAELWGRHGQGFTPWEVNDVIRNVHLDGCYNFFVPVSANVSAAFDAESKTITIPATFTKGIYRLQYLPDSDYTTWDDVDPATDPGGSGWWVERGLRTISIGGSHWLDALDGTTLRLHGYGVEAELDDDADTTGLNKEWIVTESMRRLVSSSMHGQVRSGESDRSTYQDLVRRSEIARQRAIMRPHPNWQRV